MLTDADVINAVRAWLERAVIGLNLCPFAKAPFSNDRLRYVVSLATTENALLHDLGQELTTLQHADPAAHETTLLIHPHVLTDFLDYNDFLDRAEATLSQLDLDGIIQIASFHPQYQFSDTTPDDITNYTNRSPYPLLHLLREASVEAALASYPNAEEIIERNLATMQQLGHAGWQALKVGPKN